jgi:hypothetical protein
MRVVTCVLNLARVFQFTEYGFNQGESFEQRLIERLAYLSLQRFDALSFGNSWPWTLAGITLLLVYLEAQRLGGAADLGRDQRNYCPL